jgi:ABC-type multidrug transport system permease subunit
MTQGDENFTFNQADQNITFAQAQSSNDSSIVFSFCSTLTYKTFQWRYYELCSDYFKRFEQHWIYIGTLALVVAAVTLILIKIVFTMTELRRFRTLPEKRRFMILSIFITYLVSSSLLTLLIRAEVNWGEGSFSLVKWAQGSFPTLAVKNNLEVYNEMTRKWYM